MITSYTTCVHGRRSKLHIFIDNPEITAHIPHLRPPMLPYMGIVVGLHSLFPIIKYTPYPGKARSVIQWRGQDFQKLRYFDALRVHLHDLSHLEAVDIVY